MIAVNFGGKDTIFVWFYGKSISLSLYKKICDMSEFSFTSMK